MHRDAILEVLSSIPSMPVSAYASVAQGYESA